MADQDVDTAGVDPRRDPSKSAFNQFVGLVDVAILEEPDEDGSTWWRIVRVYDDGTRREGGRNRSKSAASRTRNKIIRALQEFNGKSVDQS